MHKSIKRILKWTTLIGGLSVPVFTSLSCASTVKANEKSKAYKFEDILFKNKNDLIEYALKNLVEITKEEDQNTIYTLKTGNGIMKFASSYLLRNFLSDNINVIKANVMLEDTEEYSNGVPSNLVIPWANGKNGGMSGLTTVYEGRDDSAYFNTKNAENDAVKSWMQFHNAYLYNGIYFRNKEDLDFYLHHKFASEVKNKTGAIEDLKTVMFNLRMNPYLPPANHFANSIKPTTPSYKQISIPKNDDGTYDLKDFKVTLKEQIRTMSKPYLEYTDGQGTHEFSLMDTNPQWGNIAEHLNGWEIGDRTKDPIYIVDSRTGSRGDLYGQYFLKTPSSPR